MGTEIFLTLAMMAAVVVVYAVFHQLLRRMPFERAVPREQYRWPVWNWYAIVVVVGLLTGLAANLYWTARTGATDFDEEGDGPEIEHIRGIDNEPYGGAPSPSPSPLQPN